ncbi:hypothetical protein N657DRAFT_650580 [Parathielavia appendiculata]|uniref:Uncharacterized protein n=1 Tax=Parathielavia appendiculata TaxID=2587402 RepID=A0AAN6TQV9_9PEZI|nr:hypothetical protein N657DRAFT_650580 [Parathielavia appendiculata]
MKLELESRFQSDHTMKDQDSGLGCLRMSPSCSWNKIVLSNHPRGITPLYRDSVP